MNDKENNIFLKKFIVVLIIVISFLLPHVKALAVTSNTEEDTETYKKTYTMLQSEWEEPDSTIYLEDDDGEQVEYTLSSFEYTESESNTKAVTQTVTKEDLTSNTESYIREIFDETYNYSDEEGYSGTLSFASYDVTTVDQGDYEQIESLDISFTDYTMNDLNNISKETISGGYTWYLINVDWEVQTSSTVDGIEVPIYYQGTMHYQRVATYSNPDHYDVTVTYEGEATVSDLLYDVVVEYTMVEPEVIEVESEPEVVEETSYVPQIIISGLAIILIIVIFIILNKNAKIYNKQTDGSYKLVKRTRISNKGSNVIDLDSIKYKINTNLYMLKISKSKAKKLNGTTVIVGKDENKIYVKLNETTETEFKI